MHIISFCYMRTNIIDIEIMKQLIDIVIISIIITHQHTVFPRMSAPALIISTVDVLQGLFDTRLSNETHYLEGKRS